MASYVPNVLLNNMDKSKIANRLAIFDCKNEFNSILMDYQSAWYNKFW